MKLRSERIDDHNIRVLARREHSLLVDKPPGPRPRDKNGRRVTLGRATLDRTALGLPFVEAAIEHGGARSSRCSLMPKRQTMLLIPN